MKLSVVIITFNEENHIGECLENVKWADDIVIIDSFSMDKTVEMGRLAVDSGAWALWECENDVMVFNGKSKLILEKKVERKSVEDWIKYQGRFSHLFKPERDVKRLQEIEEHTDQLWERYRRCYLEKK